MMRLLDAVFLLQVVPLCKRKMKAIGAPYRKTMSIFPMGAAGGNRNMEEGDVVSLLTRRREEVIWNACPAKPA